MKNRPMILILELSDEECRKALEQDPLSLPAVRARQLQAVGMDFMLTAIAYTPMERVRTIGVPSAKLQMGIEMAHEFIYDLMGKKTIEFVVSGTDQTKDTVVAYGKIVEANDQHRFVPGGRA